MKLRGGGSPGVSPVEGGKRMKVKFKKGGAKGARGRGAGREIGKRARGVREKGEGRRAMRKGGKGG